MIGNTVIMPVVKSLIHHHVIRKSWCPNPNKIAPPLPMFPSINHFTSYVPFSNNVFPLITPSSWRPIRSKKKILANLRNCLLERLYFVVDELLPLFRAERTLCWEATWKYKRKIYYNIKEFHKYLKSLLQYQGTKTDEFCKQAVGWPLLN